ncbi:MAG: HIT domain-containing protein [Rhabdochlamydiaceae bacterium]|nr:HIT domain-containing protein [Rhabdochlamydiaceae bacterium]
MTFTLHPNLLRKTFVCDLPLCQVLLEDESHYPWLFLVPRRPNIARMMDLSPLDQRQLMEELDLAQKILWEEFHPTQINVAALGNKTPQLHVHVIARFLDDPAWPGAVWDHPVKKPYEVLEKEKLVLTLRGLFERK